MIDAAIVLAAGLGTRLAPLSWVRAKAALPVAGETLLRRQLRWLAAAGIRRVVVNLHHLPATVTATAGHGEDLGVDVRYSWEPAILGSAGGPARAFQLLDADRAYVINGDTLTDLDLHAIAAAHEASGAAVTLAAVPGDLRRYNALLADADGALAGVAPVGAAPPSGLDARHFIGVQVVDRAAFDGVSPDQPSESLKRVYPALLARRPRAVRIWPCEATFHDVGTPAEYLRTVGAFTAGGGAFDRGARTTVDGGARLTRVACWDDVRVDAGADLVDCVLADGVHVPAGLQLRAVSVVPRACGAARPADQVVGDLLIAPFETGPPASPSARG